MTESYDRLSRLLILLGVTAYSLPERVHGIQQEHNAINKALQNSDAQAAEAAMKTHLMHGLEARLRLMTTINTNDID